MSTSWEGAAAELSARIAGARHKTPAERWDEIEDELAVYGVSGLYKVAAKALLAELDATHAEVEALKAMVERVAEEMKGRGDRASEVAARARREGSWDYGAEDAAEAFKSAARLLLGIGE